MVAIGLLNAQYTLTGYDASAHMSEETHQAHTAAAKGIVNSVWISVVVGFILLVAVSYAIPHLPVTIGGVTYTNYDGLAVDLVPWATIFEYAAGRAVGLMLILVVIVAQFFCGMSSVTANSRMMYAFARDGAVPGLQLLAPRQHARPRPRPNRWLGAVGAFILALPYLYNAVAYAAVTSIAVIGLYIAYITPVFLRRINPQRLRSRAVEARQLGPDHQLDRDRLGRLHRHPADAAAVRPGRHAQTFNYAPIAVGVVVGVRRPLVRCLGPQVVQGPQGPGFGRGARRDRARPDHLTCSHSPRESRNKARRALPAAPVLLSVDARPAP